MESEEAGEEFDNTRKGWKPDVIDNVPDDWKPGECARRLEKEERRTEVGGEAAIGLEGQEPHESTIDGWKPDEYTSMLGGEAENKFRFKQATIHKFFKNKELLDLDKEMRRLEKDRKSKKENARKERRLKNS